MVTEPDNPQSAGASSESHWTPLSSLSETEATGSPGGTHPLAVEGDTVHAVWERAQRLYYRRSLDRRETWGRLVEVVASGTAHYPCSLEVCGSALHLIWPDSRHGTWEVFHKRSLDGGETWGADQRLTPGVHLFRLATAIGDGEVHVAWASHRSANPTPGGLHTWGEIYHLRSAAGGEAWEPIIRLTEPEATAMRPAIAVSGDFVHVTWFDRRNARQEWDWDIYYRRSTDGGRTWEPEVRLTRAPTHTRHPQIVADAQGRVCCLWEDGQVFNGRNWEGDAALFAAVSQDKGETWAEPKRLTFVNVPRSWATHAKSYACGARVHLAWTDSPEGPDRPHSVYYMTSSDCGLTWGPPERLTEPSDGACWAAGVAGTESYAVVSIAKSGALHCRRRELGS